VLAFGAVLGFLAVLAFGALDFGALFLGALFAFSLTTSLFSISGAVVFTFE
jgi:hypothetical protein